MEFPTLVYRCPGPHGCQGGTYESKQVLDQAHFDAAINARWSETLPQAIYGNDPAKIEPVAHALQSAPLDETAEDDKPPTREELTAKATELRIKFDGRISDAKLGALIAAKLAK